MSPRPLHREDHISQVPALQLLQNMGWQYVSPDEAVELRGGRTGGVILDGVLEDWLKKNNHIEFKGKVYPFSENNVATGINALKEFMFDGLVRTNEKVYDLLCLGKALPQTILGDTKSFTFRYIDWEHPENNAYHVTEEFAVERTGSREHYRPDLVLFVNGIPFVVIECKKPDVGGPAEKDPIKQAISQHIRNQKDDGIPRLFIYAQLLMAVSVNQAKYGTVGTEEKFWAVWKEAGLEKEVAQAINAPITGEQKAKLFVREDRAKYVLPHMEAMQKDGPREVTEQDRAIYALCRPGRLLELAYRFTLYDAGEKKIARYQQYFCVRSILERIQTRTNEGARRGGVVWHTQGSGKSLTMVMLAKCLALEREIPNPKIVLVTDRIDLDDQIRDTFKHCGEEVEQARTGKHLVELLQDHKKHIITTVIDKFEAAAGQSIANLDENTFVLVDEGHRGQYRARHSKMRKSMKQACFIAFTGTPIMKKDRDTYVQFGGLIEPAYTIANAVEDKAVVPLIYEGRHVPQTVEKQQIDSWFEKLTRGLTKEQTADLKKKFSSADQLNKAEQKVRMIAWDVSAHYDNFWKGTGFKAQLVAPDKATALLYKKFLDEFRLVSSEVLISAPDTREGETDVDESNKSEVVTFWKRVLDKYGTEKQYNKLLINAFKHGETPEIIIVVDKLLTGFDAPRNTVMYLTRKLTGHTLLQAIARVNRLHDGKDFGYILDYRGVLEELDQALDFYADLTEFDKHEVEGTVTDIRAQYAKLPQRHSELWDCFKAVKNTRDREQYERLLADEELRVRFYEKFAVFARVFALALSSVSFLEETPEKKLQDYKKDLKFFTELRASVRRRYAEVIDYSEYEPKIKKLIDTHVGTGEVEKITGAVDLFNKEKRQEAVTAAKGEASMADTIAYNTKRIINVRMDEDPAFYKRFSDMLQEVIDAFRAQRLAEVEYLKKAREIETAVLNRTDESIPSSLTGHDMARRYYGVIYEVMREKDNEDDGDLRSVSAAAAIEIEKIIQDLCIRDWKTNKDQLNKMRTAIEDHLFRVAEQEDLDLNFEGMDAIMDRSLDIAMRVMP
jgi:type I restriction enzyme R subunit